MSTLYTPPLPFYPHPHLITFAKGKFRKNSASLRPWRSLRENKKHQRALMSKYFWQSV
jgi:hypothetical protein